MMKTILLIAMSSLLITANASAQTPDGAADLTQNIRVGQNVAVRMVDGSEVQGAVLEVSAAQLVIATTGGAESVSAARIREVSWRRRDGVWNGLVIGAAAGALVGWLSLFMNDCEFDECAEAATVPATTAVGAVAGAGIDLLWRGRQVLYRAPQGRTSLHIGVLAGRSTGARVSWRF